jgi:hypothetical protein
LTTTIRDRGLVDGKRDQFTVDDYLHSIDIREAEEAEAAIMRDFLFPRDMQREHQDEVALMAATYNAISERGFDWVSSDGRSYRIRRGITYVKSGARWRRV